MGDVLAEDYRFCESVRRFEEFGDLCCNYLRPLFEDEVAVIVSQIVFAIFNLLPILVRLPFLRPPAFKVLVETNPDNLVRRKKAIGYSLPEGIRVERITEILDVGNILGLLGVAVMPI